MRTIFRAFWGITLAATLAGIGRATSDDYKALIEQWRAGRVARLTAPDGWLSLTGLCQLKPGANRVGSAPDSDARLKSGPPHLGTVSWSLDGTVRIELSPEARASIDGRQVRSAQLSDDSNDKPTIVSFGTTTLYLVTRGDRKALRIKDSQASTRTGFRGLDYFPIDPSWRIEAQWVPFNPPQEIRIASIIGTTETDKAPGKAVFKRDGKSYELLPIQESPDSLFFIISDETSGKETYSAARFLHTELPQDGKVVLDFNRATNPPCAFTPFATCPLPPKQNQLKLRITAGEKTYQGTDHREASNRS